MRSPRYPFPMSKPKPTGWTLATLLFLSLGWACLPSPAQTPSPSPSLHEDQALDRELQSIAAAHHGKLAVYAHNLRTGQTASLTPDLPVKTASTIKLGILLDAAEQIRAGHASLSDKLVLEHANQVGGSGVLGELTAPLALT